MLTGSINKWRNLLSETDTMTLDLEQYDRTNFLSQRIVGRPGQLNPCHAAKYTVKSSDMAIFFHPVKYCPCTLPGNGNSKDHPSQWPAVSGNYLINFCL